MSPATAAADVDAPHSQASRHEAPAPATVAACLQRGTRALASRSESPRLDAELLLCHTLKVSRAALVVHDAETVNTADQCRYEDLIAQRAARMPIAYLVGRREFWSLDPGGIGITALTHG
jgi:release factor glutamine methyltransferase